MSLLLAGAIVGASITLLALGLIAVTVGIHRQEHAASLGHQPASLSAALARRILGLHSPRPPGLGTDRTTDDSYAPKETTR